MSALADCVRIPEPAVAGQGRSDESPNPTLLCIDSLMWQRSDSALARLLPYFDTCRTDGACTASTAYNHHYAHLLLAELLYKNDCAQITRPELLRAVDYFDSLVRQAPSPKSGLSRRAGELKKTQPKNLSTHAFLAARAHYINGVGYYENDSVTEACREYLQALEIMEGHFKEKELVGHKAQFMAYTFNRLGAIFSDQYMMETAIICFENALHYSLISPTSPLGVSRIFNCIGLQFAMLEDFEQALHYYGKALEQMPDTDNATYHDIQSHIALCNYNMGLRA